MARSKLKTWIMMRQLRSQYYNFPKDKDQLTQIKDGIKSGLSLKDVKLYAFCNNAKKMEQIKLALEEGCYHGYMENYSPERIEAVRTNIKRGYTEEQAHLYSKYTPKQVELHSKYAFDLPCFEKLEIQKYIERGVGEKEIEILSKAYKAKIYSSTDIDRLYEILKHQTKENKELISEALDKKIGISLIKEYFSERNSLPADYLRMGLEKRMHLAWITECADKKYDSERIDTMCKGLDEGFPFNQVSHLMDMGIRDVDQMKFINELKERDLLEEHKIINEAVRGFRNGLTIDQVKMYTACYDDNERYGCKYELVQMREIRLGLEHGLTMEQVSLYANDDPDGHEFNEWQMREIRLGLEHGLTMERVSLYANRETAWSIEHMRSIRIGLEKGLPPEKAIHHVDISENINLAKEIIAGKREYRWDENEYSDDLMNIIILKLKVDPYVFDGEKGAEMAAQIGADYFEGRLPVWYETQLEHGWSEEVYNGIVKDNGTVGLSLQQTEQAEETRQAEQNRIQWAKRQAQWDEDVRFAAELAEKRVKWDWPAQVESDRPTNDTKADRNSVNIGMNGGAYDIDMDEVIDESFTVKQSGKSNRELSR